MFQSEIQNNSPIVIDNEENVVSKLPIQNSSTTNTHAEKLANARNFNLELIEGMHTITVPLLQPATGKSTKSVWPLYRLPPNGENPWLIDYNQYDANILDLISNWCFFHGTVNSTDARVKSKCMNHLICAYVRAAIAEEGCPSTVIKNGLTQYLIKHESSSASKKRKIDNSEITKVELRIWPKILDNYTNCVEVCDGDCDSSEVAHPVTFFMRLNSSAQGLTYPKLNGVLSQRITVESLFKNEQNNVEILGVCDNTAAIVPITPYISKDEGLWLGDIDLRNVNVVYEKENNFSSFIINLDSVEEITNASALAAFKDIACITLYGSGYNKATMVDQSENQMVFVGRSSNLNVGISKVLEQWAQFFNVTHTVKSTQHDFSKTLKIKMYTSCETYDKEHQVNMFIRNIPLVNFKRFVKSIVSQYNAKIENISPHTSFSSTSMAFETLQFTIVGIQLDIVKAIVNKEKALANLDSAFILDYQN